MGEGAAELGQPRPRRRRRWLRRSLFAFLGMLVVVISMHQHVVWSASGLVLAASEVPVREVVIVLGARIHPDGRPYPMLADRLRTAASLHRAGKARRILVSGDAKSSPDYDEVAAMRDYLLELGVPDRDLILDRAGLRTLDTMYRAADVYGVKNAIVVSNPFHVARAVFLGLQRGMDVVGVAAEHGQRYSTGTLFRNRGREVLARLRAWADVFVLGTQPTVGGGG